MKHTQFDHEKLKVYQESLRFVGWASDVLERIPTKMAVYNQLDRASTSIPLNIAEGTAKHTIPDRCRYFDTARGSAVECAACLDILITKRVLTMDDIQLGKEMLLAIMPMLIGLIRANSQDRLREETVYQAGEE